MAAEREPRLGRTSSAASGRPSRADAAIVLWSARMGFGPAPGRRASPLPWPAAEAASSAEMTAAPSARLTWALEGIDEPALL